MPPALLVGGREVKIQDHLLKLAKLEGDSYRFPEDPERIILGLRRSGQRIDLFTFLQRLPDRKPKYDYPMEWDNLAALRVSTFEHWWTQVLGFKARNKARQAEKKGLETRELPFGDQLTEGIWRIYNECPVRQGKPFPHYGMSRDQIRDHAGTFLECSVFLGAFVDGILIGFAKLTIDESYTQAGLMHIVSMMEHRDKAPSNALIAEAVRACATRKIPFLVYSKFAYGNKQRDSLSDFKERNGFQRVDIPRYYVPLTRFGKLGFHMKMHRSLIERLPEPLITRFRDYRSSWYNARIPQTLQGR